MLGEFVDFLLTHGQAHPGIPQVLVVHAVAAAAELDFALLLAISESFFLMESLWQSGQCTSSIAEARISSSSKGCPQSSHTNS